MYFYFSRIANLILFNQLLLITVGVLITIVLYKLHSKTIAKLLTISIGIYFLIIAILPTGSFMMHSLEKQYDIPTELPNNIDGILVLSGGENVTKSKKYNQILIMLGDQPLITAAYLNKLIDKAKEQPETCVASGYKNKKGVPAIFPESYFDALEKLSGDQGAKALLNSDRSVIALNAEDLLQDIDTPEDYERLLKK